MFEGGRRARGSSDVTGARGGEDVRGWQSDRSSRRREIVSDVGKRTLRRGESFSAGGKYAALRRPGRKYWIKGELCGIANARARARARGLDRNNVIIPETSDACSDRSPGSSRLRRPPVRCGEPRIWENSASARETFVRHGRSGAHGCTSVLEIERIHLTVPPSPSLTENRHRNAGSATREREVG